MDEIAQEKLTARLKEIKLRLLRMHFESHTGHIGANLSCVDPIALLFHKIMGPSDEFVLSKGHAAGALYSVLWSLGVLSDEDLKGFHRDGSHLAGHPVSGWLKQISFSTGSLGHGASLAAGMALGKRLQNKSDRIFCLTSDGEWQEGSTWEAVMFIARHQLNHVTLIIDANGLQGFGTVKEVSCLEPLSEKISQFPLIVEEVDGHDVKTMAQALETPRDRPLVLILKTIKGKGVSYMEGRLEWHYIPMDEEQYQKACEEISRS
jgi:transketolase